MENNEYKKLQEDYEKLKKENEKNKEIVGEYKESRRALAHGLRGIISNLMNYNHLLKHGELDKETKEEINLGSEKDLTNLLNLAELLYLDGLDKKELKKRAEPLYLEEIARNHIIPNQKLMKKENIEAKIKYNKKEELAMQFYGNKGVFNTIWESLIGNAFNYAPKDSTIKQGIRVNDNMDLEILTENEHYGQKARQVSGMSKGIGVPFTQRLITTLGGKYSNYFNSEIKKENYSLTESYGAKPTKKSPPTEIWGVRIELPIEELIEKSY